MKLPEWWFLPVEAISKPIAKDCFDNNVSTTAYQSKLDNSAYWFIGSQQLFAFDDSLADNGWGNCAKDCHSGAWKTCRRCPSSLIFEDRCTFLILWFLSC
jgi:hypothetical protein